MHREAHNYIKLQRSHRRFHLISADHKLVVEGCHPQECMLLQNQSGNAPKISAGHMSDSGRLPAQLMGTASRHHCGRMLAHFVPTPQITVSEGMHSFFKMTTTPALM